jgi:hypothetical protein
MARFFIQIFMKDGRKFKGIREFKGLDQYQVMKICEQKIQKWNELKNVSGFIVDKLKD